MKHCQMSAFGLLLNNFEYVEVKYYKPLPDVLNHISLEVLEDLEYHITVSIAENPSQQHQKQMIAFTGFSL